MQTQNVSLPYSTGTAFECSRFLLSSRTTVGVWRKYGFSTADDSAVCQNFLFKRDTKRETEACQQGRSHKGWGETQLGHPAAVPAAAGYHLGDPRALSQCIAAESRSTLCFQKSPNWLKSPEVVQTVWTLFFLAVLFFFNIDVLNFWCFFINLKARKLLKSK